MSDQDIIDTIAVAVGRHEYWQLPVSEDWECACGETALFKVEMDQHIASTIAAALRERYEIVPKLEPDVDNDERTAWGKGVYVEVDKRYLREPARWGVACIKHRLGAMGSVFGYEPEGAKWVAAALLAAADAAESAK